MKFLHLVLAPVAALLLLGGCVSYGLQGDNLNEIAGD